MNSPEVTVIDYGMGNLWSVLSALRYLGCNPLISADPDEIADAESLLLPGVGSFRKAMIALIKQGLDQAIIEAVKTKGSKILGICLGMHLLGSSSSEDGDTVGLGLIPGGRTNLLHKKLVPIKYHILVSIRCTVGRMHNFLKV